MLAPRVVPARTYESASRTARSLFYWRAADLDVRALTGHAGTFGLLTAAGAATKDSRGSALTFVPGQPRWDCLDLDGDGIYETPTLCLDQILIDLGSDLFTGVEDTWINNHLPDSGFTSWVEGMNGPNALFIKSNKLKCTAGYNFARDHVLAFPALVDDNFEYYADIVPAGNSAYAGLRFRCDDQIKTVWNDATTKSDFMGVRFVLSSGPTLVGFQVFRFADSVQQEIYTVASSINLSDLYTAGRCLGVTVAGATVQVWTEPHGGGTRTNRGAAQTMLVTYLDGAHKQFGLDRFGNGEIGTTWDRLTLRQTEVENLAWVPGLTPRATALYIDTARRVGTGLEILRLGGATGTRLALLQDAATYTLTHYVGASSVSSVLTAAPTAGQRVRLLALLYSDGSVQLKGQVGAATEVTATRSAALVLASAWASDSLSLHAPGNFLAARVFPFSDAVPPSLTVAAQEF